MDGSKLVYKDPDNLVCRGKINVEKLQKFQT